MRKQFWSGVFFTKWTDLTGFDGGFNVGQSWFLLYLFIILLPFLYNLLSIGGKSFAEYIYIFLIGFYVFLMGAKNTRGR